MEKPNPLLSRSLAMTETTRIILPPKLVPVFAGKAIIRGAYGGRASAKSSSFATMAAVRGYSKKQRIVCGREYQKSIKESFKSELEVSIRRYPFLERHYTVGEEYIRGKNGTEFLFEGLRKNIDSLKSISDIDLTILEETETTSEDSYRVALPTFIRKPGSELWLIWNPKLENSPTDLRFRKNMPPGSKIVELNYRDNPWFTEESEFLRQLDASTMDAEMYAHVWDGEYLKLTNARILARKLKVRAFTPNKDFSGPYHGLDWGFANDPTAGVRCWTHDNCLYVEYEAGKVGLELDDTASYFKQRIPGIEKFKIRADSARPESISHVKRKGLPQIEAVMKWPGSVEDGIAHLLSYREIIVHPRCTETADECLKYSYKVDKQSGDPLPEIVDKFNHYIDAIRYAVSMLIKPRQFFIGRA